jgi:hypothetical protein
VGFVPVVPAPINDLGLIRSPQSTKSTGNLSIRYKTGTAETTPEAVTSARQSTWNVAGPEGPKNFEEDRTDCQRERVFHGSLL